MNIDLITDVHQLMLENLTCSLKTVADDSAGLHMLHFALANEPKIIQNWSWAIYHNNKKVIRLLAQLKSIQCYSTGIYIRI